MLIGLERVVIYGLIDPDDGVVKYVGSTTNAGHRYREHLQMPRRANAHLNTWIKSLIDKNKKPMFVFIDLCNKEEREQIEYKWIEHFSKLSVLFNHKIKPK